MTTGPGDGDAGTGPPRLLRRIAVSIAFVAIAIAIEVMQRAARWSR